MSTMRWQELFSEKTIGSQWAAIAMPEILVEDLDHKSFLMEHRQVN